MWILIVVTFFTLGNQYGSNSIKEIKFYTEKACLQAAENLNKMLTPGVSDDLKRHSVKAFCVKDVKPTSNL